MPKLSIKVTPASLKRIAKELELDAEGIVEKTDEQLWAIATDAAANAEELFQWAEYDGYKEDITVSPERGKDGKILVTAKGQAVKFIEYGAGDGDYWFFSGKGRNIALDAGGAQAQYTRLLREKDEETDSIWFEFKGRRYLGEPIITRGNYSTETVDKSDSYITRGNEPQFIMQSAFEDIINRIDEF